MRKCLGALGLAYLSPRRSRSGQSGRNCGRKFNRLAAEEEKIVPRRSAHIPVPTTHYKYRGSFDFDNRSWNVQRTGSNMEKSTLKDAAPRQQPHRPSVKTAFLFAPLLAFLFLYNFVPNVHESVQSFFTIQSLSDPTISVQLKQGTYLGKVLPEENHPVPIEAFLGIPYALPPVGERRFARAVPVPQSNETFNATEYSMR